MSIDPSFTISKRLHLIFIVGLSCCVFHIAIQASQTPFTGTPWSIPGTIEAENFDEGGEGVAYHDTTATNEGGVYRNTAVDIFASAAASNGYYVGLGQGEWLEYTVNIAETGSYDFYSIMLRGTYTLQEFHLLLDEVEVSGPIAGPHFSGGSSWMIESNWGEASKQGIVLKAGQHVIRLYVSRGELDVVSFDNLRFTRSTLVPSQVISGSGQPGFADGAPELVQFSTNINGLDVDMAGNVYVADSGNYRVRKVSPDGRATTLAGNGTDGTANGPGDQAQFSMLRGVAVDDLGNCYVTDGSSIDSLNKIRKITSDRQVSNLYSEARGITNFSSITLNLSGEVHFITSATVFGPGFSYYTISKLSPLGSKFDVFWRQATGHSGTVLNALSLGHASDIYYLGLERNFAGGDWNVARVEATGESTVLYSAGVGVNQGPIVHLHGLVADRSGNVYFSVGSDLTRLPRSGAPATVYVSVPDMPDAFATDVSGNVYAFDNNRLIKLLVNYRGVGLTAFTDGGGVVTVDPHGPVYVTNSVVQVAAAAWPGWTFLGWTNDLSGTQTNLTLTLTNHLSLQAVFAIPLQTAVTNGTVLRDPDYGLYPYGTLVQLTAQPDIGFEFIRWSDGITNPVRIVEVTNFITLSPLFLALPRYTLTVSALGGAGGTISRSPDQADYFRDTAVLVSAHPANGYVFQVWLDNFLDNPRTVIMSSNTTLFAAFAQGQGTPPQITTTPQSTNVFVGGRATFTVAAQGSPPLTYQWQFKGTNIPGAVAPTLILSQVQTNHSGTYTIIVSNSIDTATADAVLNVFTPFRFETVSIQSDSWVHMTLSGEAGRRYQIDRSGDLTNWQQLTVVTNTTGLAEFAEPIVGGVGQRFYRAVLLPGQ